MELEKLINRITDIAEDKGWSVYTEPKDALVEFEFSQSTDFGQDFSFSASMNDGDIYSLIKDVNDYYEGYDPDEEALLWVGSDGHGKNGAPSYRRTCHVHNGRCHTYQTYTGCRNVMRYKVIWFCSQS